MNRFMRFKEYILPLVFIVLFCCPSDGFAQEWDILESDCKDLLNNDDGAQAVILAQKMLAVSAYKREKVKSLYYLSAAYMMEDQVAEADRWTDLFLTETKELCMYSRFENSIDSLGQLMNAYDKSGYRIGKPKLSYNKEDAFVGDRRDAWYMLPIAFGLKGSVCLSLDEPSNAERYFLSAMSLGSQLLGEDSTFFGECCLDLGETYATDDQDVVAIPFFQKAITVFLANKENDLLEDAREMLVDSLQESGQSKKAEVLKAEWERTDKQVIESNRMVGLILGGGLLIFVGWLVFLAKNNSSLKKIN
jgi:hypothetical protein